MVIGIQNSGGIECLDQVSGRAVVIAAGLPTEEDLLCFLVAFVVEIFGGVIVRVGHRDQVVPVVVREPGRLASCELLL